jgi:ribosomal protein S18 acetylase RimI-like enzyme
MNAAVLSGDKTMIAMIEKNLFELFALFRRWSCVELEDTPELLLTTCPIPFPLFNNVLRAGFLPERADETIQIVTEHYAALGVPALWWVGPSSQPDDLGARLLRHGFCLYDTVPGMGIKLRALKHPDPMPRGFSIQRVEDAATLADWCAVMSSGFKLTNSISTAVYDLCNAMGIYAESTLQHYVGYLDGQPVASSSAHFGLDAVGVYNICTVPTARGRGIATQMTLRPLADARTAGYQTGILHASRDSFGVYAR